MHAYECQRGVRVRCLLDLHAFTHSSCYLKTIPRSSALLLSQDRIAYNKSVFEVTRCFYSNEYIRFPLGCVPIFNL
jgi:hypothetical protein